MSRRCSKDHLYGRPVLTWLLCLLAVCPISAISQSTSADLRLSAATQENPDHATATPVGNADSGPAESQEARDCESDASVVSPGYHLAELIDLAQCLNPQARAAHERWVQAKSAVGLAKATYWPQVSLQATGGFQRTPLPIPASLVPAGYFTSNTREFIPALSAKWLLFDFGRRSSTRAAAEAKSDETYAGLSGVEQKIVFGVVKTYYRLIASRGKHRAAQEALNAAQIEKNAAVGQQQHGRATVVFVAQTNRALAQAQLNMVKTEGEVDSAYASLLAAVGLPPTRRVAVADMPPGFSPMLPDRPLSSYIDDALTSRPDARAAAAEVSAAAWEEKAAKAEYRPTISMSAQYFQNIGSLSSDGSPYVSVNKSGGAVFVNFDLPLFDGGLRRSQVHIASSKVAEAQDRLDEVKHGIEHDVVDAYNAVKTSSAEYGDTIALRDASKVAFEAALDAYRHGVGTYPELESSRASWVMAQASVEDATSDCETARAALALAIGHELPLRQ